MLICYARWKGGIARKIGGKVLGDPGPSIVMDLDLGVKANSSDFLHQLVTSYVQCGIRMIIFNQLKWESLDLRSLLKHCAVILRNCIEDLNLGLGEPCCVLPSF